MKINLPRIERAEILQTLTEYQRDSLFNAISNSKKTEFGNILASYKGTEKWEFEGYIDHGRRKKTVRCECGRQLRYEFILKNKETGITRSLGINHLQEELGIPNEIAKEVYKKIHQLNYDLDEILNKVRDKWALDRSLIKIINDIKSDLPEDITLLVDAKLPILERHKLYILREFSEHLVQSDERRMTELVTRSINNNSINHDIFFNDEKTSSYINKVVIPKVNSMRGVKYLITKEKLTFKKFTEVNFLRKDFVSFENDKKELRYGRNFISIEWTYYSPANIYRTGKYGARMCIIKMDYLPNDYKGLWVLFGFNSIESLQKESKKIYEKIALNELSDQIK